MRSDEQSVLLLRTSLVMPADVQRQNCAEKSKVMESAGGRTPRWIEQPYVIEKQEKTCTFNRLD